jgi:hypothetical protein
VIIVTKRGTRLGNGLALKCHMHGDRHHCASALEISRVSFHHMKPWEEQPWVDSYRLALIETNAAKMPARIEAAKSAIESRTEELSRSMDGSAERRALMDALNALRFLTQEVLC